VESEIVSLVPQTTCRFPSFAVHILPVMESWLGAWEQDYPFSTQCKSDLLPRTTANLEVLSECTIHALSYVQSEIATAQRVCVTTTKSLFAKNCRIWDL